jgi:hypothetical protein
MEKKLSLSLLIAGNESRERNAGSFANRSK